MIPIRDINPTVVKPVITLLLIAANLVVYFGFQSGNDAAETEALLYERAVIACEVTRGEPLTETEIVDGSCSDAPGTQPFPDKAIYLAGIVSMFLHGGLLHLLGNMWFLWIFGNNVEEAFGRAAYLGLFLAAGIVATAGFIFFNPDTTLPLVGASGAIAGVLGAYAVLFPRHRVLTLLVFVFVPIPSLVFLLIWLVSQFAIPVEGVAWEAHVVGFLVGAFVAGIFRRPLLTRLARLRRPIWQFR